MSWEWVCALWCVALVSISITADHVTDRLLGTSFSQPHQPTPTPQAQKQVAGGERELFERSYECPKLYPFDQWPCRLVLETKKGMCDLVKKSKSCSDWSSGNSWEPDPHNREAYASVLYRCHARMALRLLADRGGLAGRSSDATDCVSIDIGSNFGMFTALAASMGSIVHAFEGQYDLIKTLQESVEVNPLWKGRVFVHPGPATFDAGRAEKKLTVAKGYRFGGGAKKFTSWSAPYQLISPSLITTKNITLVKIDTDAVDGELLQGFLDVIRRGDWHVENFIFECSGVDNIHLSQLQELGYNIYRLNVHIGRRVFNSTGWDVAHNYKQMTQPAWGEEVFLQRAIKWAWRLHKNLTVTQLRNAYWPQPRWGGSVQFLATLEEFEEKVVPSTKPWPDRNNLGV